MYLGLPQNWAKSGGRTILRKRKTRAFIICAVIFDTMRDSTASVMQCYSNTHLTSTAIGNYCTASLFLVRPKDFAALAGSYALFLLCALA